MKRAEQREKAIAVERASLDLQRGIAAMPEL
jgi:hypothetical protein